MINKFNKFETKKNKNTKTGQAKVYIKSEQIIQVVPKKKNLQSYTNKFDQSTKEYMSQTSNDLTKSKNN